MKIEQLEQLLKIVEEGSINEAAKQLYTARSSLSTSMKNLERELEGAIFDRSSKGICLTPFGMNVYQQAKDICDKVNFLHKISVAETPHNLIVSSMYCSLACEAFIRLCEIHEPDKMTGSIEEQGLVGVFEQVKTGLADIGIVSLFEGGEVIAMRQMDELSLEFHPIMERPLYAVIGEKNPFYHDNVTEIDLHDLKEFAYIVNYGEFSDFSLEGFIETREHSKADIKVGDLAFALRLVEETSGFMIETFDKRIYERFYAPRRYKFIPLKNELMSCKLGWIKRKKTTLSALAEEYIQLLLELASL